MLRSILIALLLTAVAFARPTGVSGQTPPAPLPAAAAPQLTLRSGRVPQGFEGVSWEALADALRSHRTQRPAERDRFETTAEFEQRRRREREATNSAILADGLPLSAERAFALPIAQNLDYDPDKRRLFWPQRGSRTSMGDLLPSCIDASYFVRRSYYRLDQGVVCRDALSRLTVKSREFAASGGPLVVNKTMVAYVAFTLCGSGRGIATCSPFTQVRSILMEIDKARDLFNRGGVKAVIFGRLVEPYLVTYTQLDRQPTWDDPNATEETVRLLILRATGLLLYDPRSGEVLFRISAGS